MCYVVRKQKGLKWWVGVRIVEVPGRASKILNYSLHAGELLRFGSQGHDQPLFLGKHGRLVKNELKTENWLEGKHRVLLETLA